MTNKNLIERLRDLPRLDDCDEAAALIEQQEALLASLSKAATDFLDIYLQGVNSGDWGNWNPEKEPEVIAVRAALLAAQTHLGE